MPDHPTPPLAVLAEPRHTNRRRVIATLAAIVALAAAGLVVWRIATRPSPIHIAFANTMSGVLEPVGTEIFQAASMYVDEVNRHGGVDGHPVVFDRYDDLGSPQGARANVQAIADGPALAVLGHFLSAASLAASPGYRSAHITALTTQALADDLTRPGTCRVHFASPTTTAAVWSARRCNSLRYSTPT